MQINNHDKVRQWVKQGESDTLEFKVQIPDAPKAARAICALANTRGGYLVAGIADDGEIVGIIEPDKDK
ncbi:MAG TPA: ATP-binding protein, partial [Chitinophagales bacterium]|nr:ATP-binding protein [Chitinophagales bacterium]